VSRYRTVYPPEWKQISHRIRFERAGNRCEWCGAWNNLPHPITGSKVVLTVAHLGAPREDGSPGDKHDKSDCRDVNLAALCQRCHLNFDREDHIARQRANRAYALRKSGRPVQLALPL
jgi:hypothetical protein